MLLYHETQLALLAYLQLPYCGVAFRQHASWHSLPSSSTLLNTLQCVTHCAAVWQRVRTHLSLLSLMPCCCSTLKIKHAVQRAPKQQQQERCTLSELQCQ